MRYLVFILSLAFIIPVSGQVYPQYGARSAAMGGTGLALNDVWSVYNNPGALGALEKSAVGLAYENRFLISELSTQTLGAGYCTKNAGNFGVHYQQYGFELYREMQGGLSYGKQLFRNFYGGVTINFHRVQLGENYGSKNAASAGLGIFYQVKKELAFGVRIQNLSRTRLADFEDERLPTRFGVGVLYRFSEKANWSLEAEKTLVHPINIKSGLEIHPHEMLFFRLGINSYPFQSSFGLGVRFKRLDFDLATLWHSTLGLSPSAGLKFSFN